jgi:hypothetical protein
MLNDQRDPLFKDGPKSFEDIASECKIGKPGMEATAAPLLFGLRSPFNNKPLLQYKCGDIPVVADLESRVVFPQTI